MPTTGYNLGGMLAVAGICLIAGTLALVIARSGATRSRAARAGDSRRTRH